MSKPTASIIPLQGVALIEASAGTGKTWTLTGIILRLIVEAGHDPRKIVATTFTRAAAAEMRRRIYGRLQDFHLLLQILRPDLPTDDPVAKCAALAAGDFNVLSASERQLLSERVVDNALIAIAQDKINQYLIEYLQLSSDDSATTFAIAQKRTQLAIEEIDHFFIGTLDSLCQRWLYEYALETGASKININEESPIIRHLVHDLLRNYFQQQAEQLPESFADFYHHSGKDSDAYINCAKSILGYGEAIIDPIMNALPVHFPSAHFSAAEIEAAIHFLQHGQKNDFFNKQTILAKKPDLLTNLIQAIQQQRPIKNEIEKFFSNICTLREKKKFKKNVPSDYQEQFLTNPIFLFLEQYQQAQQKQAQNQAYLKTQSIVDIITHCREKLPTALEKNNETLYSELLAKMNQAIRQSPDNRLGRNITFHYPILLVDESQDLNREQAKFIEQLHLQMVEQMGGFLLLVGDPKQAIYRFRGSDVNNYRHLRQQIPANKIYALQENYRSSPAVIDAVNHLYHGTAGQSLGKGIVYTTMTAARTTSRIFDAHRQPVSTPVLWFSSQNMNDERNQIKDLVLQLTQAQGLYLLQETADHFRPLQYEDILIITRSNRNARQLEQLLQQYGIPTARNSDSSIFAGDIAIEFGFLLQAMLQPQNIAIVRRLLAGKLYGFAEQDLQKLQQNDPILMAFFLRFQEQLQIAQEKWQQYGLLSALQEFLLGQNLRQQTVWETLAQQPIPDRQRDLLDLRQIQHIIAEFSPSMRPNTFSNWWQKQCQELPTKDWAVIQPLSEEKAVRIMTIHKAKGLQSPVVIMAGFNGHNNDKAFHLQTYPDTDGQLHINAIQDAEKDFLPPDLQQQIITEEADELARQLYVAITRAEDLLFIFYPQKRCLPALELLQQNGTPAPFLPAEMLANAAPTPPAKSSPPQTVATTMSPRYGWGKTSFSALLRDLHGDAYNQAVFEDSAAELQGDPIEINPLHDFRFQFPRGTEAGSFLHEVLEKVRPAIFFQRQNERSAREYTTQFLTRLWQKYHLEKIDNLDEKQDFSALECWIEDILHTPLEGQMTLARLTERHCQREMGFNLAILLQRYDATRTKRINQLLRRWGKALQLPVTAQESRFLRGEIDLVYQAGNKFYLVDYKSNYLGDDARSYTPQAMEAAMNQHGYWLQALIYQVALHRLLQVRLPTYDPATHLGAPQYLFLRGIVPVQPVNGHYTVDLPLQLVLEFDDILQAHQDEKS